MYLFTVDDTFEITGRGIVLTPGLGDKVGQVPNGSSIKLILPDKSLVYSSIRAIQFEGDHPIMIDVMSKDDVPIGTEVWLNQ
jgi:hypothetical protein